jgi:hypothetical protein
MYSILVLYVCVQLPRRAPPQLLSEALDEIQMKKGQLYELDFYLCGVVPSIYMIASEPVSSRLPNFAVRLYLSSCVLSSVGSVLVSGNTIQQQLEK